MGRKKLHLSNKQVAWGGAAVVAIAICTVVGIQIWRSQPLPDQSLQKAETSCGIFASVEQLRDNRMTFRLCAPNVAEVQVVEDSNSAPPMVKGANGLFTSTTTRALTPNYYRYFFLVDGVRTVDPHANNFTETLDGVMGLFEVKGEEPNFAAFHKDVPHGAVVDQKYWSKSLGAKRRVQIYTPPGYSKDAASYPVLYLLHGTGDNDDSWGTIGRTNNILDNLIASGRVAKMIVVMPAGHTPLRGPEASASPAGIDRGDDDFGQDLLNDIMPLVENNYRTINDPDHRAMAGLSLGGTQTMREGLLHPELFHYIGVFSASLIDPDGYEGLNESRDGPALDRAAPQMKLVYYALGKTDPFFKDPNILMNVFARHGINATLNYSEGGHEWANWRQYLYDFAQRIFP